MAPVQEARAGGPDGAVIGGVVAVAVFVLIVAVLLIARYFMSHKGTCLNRRLAMLNLTVDVGTVFVVLQFVNSN